MSIFRRDSEPNSPSSQVPAPASPQPAPRQPMARQNAPHNASASGPTHIASGTKVVGKISGDAELVIDGNVEGEIDLDSRVVIGASGRVKGEIQARAIEVGGKVHGNVRGRERVEVLASGGLEGDVVSPRVIISEGAFFKGKVEMTDPNRTQAAAKPPAPAPHQNASAGTPPGGDAAKMAAAGKGR